MTPQVERQVLGSVADKASMTARRIVSPEANHPVWALFDFANTEWSDPKWSFNCGPGFDVGRNPIEGGAVKTKHGLKRHVEQKRGQEYRNGCNAEHLVK